MAISMTESEYLCARESYLGYCLQCQSAQDSVEPDARKYKCHACGAFAVYGIEELLMRDLIDLKE